MVTSDPRLADAKVFDWDRLISALGIDGLKSNGVHRTGPCPGPGCGGNDRFNINTEMGVFGCRRCSARGDQVALVQLVRGLDFAAALDWLMGERREETAEDRASRAQRLADAEAARKRTEAAQDKRRREAQVEGRRIWLQGKPAEGTEVRDYLTRRGIPASLLAQLPVCLRFHPALPYMVAAQGAGWQELHRGPAMLAAVQGPGGRFTAVHRTWLDLAQPKGKLHLVHNGAAVDVKKSLGSVRTGAIRLLTPAGTATMVMAEGIETTLSALIGVLLMLQRGMETGLAGAAFWAGIDLGNMSGRKVNGPGLKYAGIPDLDDDRAFVPPPWVKRLVYVMDGDSEPRFTEAACKAGLRRAMKLRPGLAAQLLRAPQGKDLNDLLMQVEPDDA